MAIADFPQAPSIEQQPNLQLVAPASFSEGNEHYWHLSDMAQVIRQDTLPFLRRKVGQGLGFLGCGAAAGIASLMYIPAHTYVGPHEARVTLNADPYITADLGPLGKGHFPTDGIGADIVLKKVPEATNGSGELVSADLSQLMDSYIQLFTDTSQNQTQIQEALERHFEASALIGGVALLESFYLIRMILRKVAGQERWDDSVNNFLNDQLPRVNHNAKHLLAALIFMLPVAGIGSQAEKPQSLPGIPVTNPIMIAKLPKGITLEGEILNLLVDRVGPAAADEWDKSNAFFDKGSSDMANKLDGTKLFPDQENTSLVMVLADIHCNIGQMKVWGMVREKLGINDVLLPGDLTMSGTVYEEQCVKTVRFRMGDKTVIVYYGGNHDTSITADQARKYGIIVADGTVINVGALKALGDNDPEHTDLFQGNDPDPATATAMGERLVAAACAAGGDVTMVNHRQEADLPAMQAGCAEEGIAGHTHVQGEKTIYCKIGDVVVGEPLIIAGTAGGAAPNKPTVIGPNGQDAVATILQVDNNTGRIVRSRVLTTHTDATSTIGPLTDFSPSPQAALSGN